MEARNAALRETGSPDAGSPPEPDETKDVTSRVSPDATRVLKVSPAASAWLADHASAIRAAETARTDSLDTKAATLAGFAGVILSISAAIALRAEEAVEPWLLVLTLALLIGAVAAALLGVLLPQKMAQPSIDELDRLRDSTGTSVSPVELQMRAIGAETKSLRHNRVVNQRKARFLQAAVLLLTAGLIGVAALATTIGTNGRTDSQPAAAQPPGGLRSRASVECADAVGGCRSGDRSQSPDGGQDRLRPAR